MPALYSRLGPHGRVRSGHLALERASNDAATAADSQAKQVAPRLRYLALTTNAYHTQAMYKRASGAGPANQYGSQNRTAVYRLSANR